MRDEKGPAIGRRRSAIGASEPVSTSTDSGYPPASGPAARSSSSSLIPHPSSLGSVLRTFVAVEIGEETRARAAAILERLRRVGATDMKWVDPRLFHLTLKFLGPTRREDLPQLSAALRGVASLAAPFELELSGVEAFPSLRRPQVIWLGVSAGVEPLARLANETEAACAALGWSREERPYQAHLTLARARDSRRGARGAGRAAPTASLPETPPLLLRALEAEREAAAGSSAVDRMVLMESVLHPHGPTYTVLDSFPLGANGVS